MKKIIIYLLLLLPFLSRGEYQIEASVRNVSYLGEDLYFDLYVKQVGDKPIYLTMSNFDFNITSLSTNIMIKYIDGSTNLKNGYGGQVYFQNFSVGTIIRDGVKVFTVNADGSSHITNYTYANILPFIDTSDNQRIGTFKITSFQGSINDVNIHLRINECCLNSKVFRLDPSTLQAVQVGLSYKLDYSDNTNRFSSSPIENLEKFEFVVYPNPSKGIVKTFFSKKVTGITVKIYDTSGRLVFKSDVCDSENLSFDLRHLSRGIYIMSVEKGLIIISEKINLL